MAVRGWRPRAEVLYPVFGEEEAPEGAGSACRAGRILVFERAPERGQVFKGKLFGAGLGGDTRGGERSGGCGCLEAGGAQVIGEGFAFLRKSVAEKAEEAVLVDLKLVKAGGKAPAKDRGVHFGRRSEGGRREGEEGFDGAEHLDGGREQAVVPRAGRGGYAEGDFALHHEDGEVEGGVAGGELEQDGRGDVVGQVAGDTEALARGRGGSGEVEVEHILLDDGYAAGIEVRAQAGGEIAVELDGENAAGARSKSVGDSAAAGSDFDDRAAGEIAEGRDDPVDGDVVNEEVLTEPGFLRHLIRW